jgi:hypothetical protein
MLVPKAANEDSPPFFDLEDCIQDRTNGAEDTTQRPDQSDDTQKAQDLFRLDHREEAMQNLLSGKWNHGLHIRSHILNGFLGGIKEKTK